MNILAIDAGNTRVKWGWAEGRRWVRQSWIPSAEAAELAAALAALPRPDRIVVSNVAGDVVAAHIAVALQPLGVDARWVRSAAQQAGVRSGYGTPGQLGSDRWAALIGAWHLFGGPCVVANAGTTTTIDALTAEGVFLGGYIVPGIGLMREALAANTAQLKLEDGRYAYFPDSTADAIASGAIHAVAGAIERMWQFMARTGEGEPLVVLSGGAAHAIAPALNVRREVIDNLVLEGLACIAQEGS